jgi:hypothetical protein
MTDIKKKNNHALPLVKERRKSGSVLTKKQRDFINFYLDHGDATKACLQAGYSQSTAYNSMRDVLYNPKVWKIVKEKLQKKQEIEDEIIIGKIMSRAQIALELNRIASSDIRNIFSDTGRLLLPDQMNENTSRSIQSIKVKEVSGEDPYIMHEINMYNKIQALKQLDDFLEKREKEKLLISKEGDIPKDATIIENGLQVTTNYDQEMPVDNSDE